MSQFNKTIESDTFQSARGGTGTGSWEAPDRALPTKARKGIIIRNVDAGGHGLGISCSKFTTDSDLDDNSFELPAGKELILELDDASQLRFAGVGGGVDYTFIAY